MNRTELKHAIADAADRAGVMGDNFARLVAAADLTDRIAVGNFRVTRPGLTCGCPATVAGFYVNGHWTTDDEAVHNFPAYFDSMFFNGRRNEIVDSGDGNWYIPVTD